jgi:hypothetical protein
MSAICQSSLRTMNGVLPPWNGRAESQHRVPGRAYITSSTHIERRLPSSKWCCSSERRRGALKRIGFEASQLFASGEEATDQLIAYHGVRVGGLASRIERSLAPHWLNLQRIRLSSAISVKRSARRVELTLNGVAPPPPLKGLGAM